VLGEPRPPTGPLAATPLAALAADGVLAWTELAGPNGLPGPRHQDMRRFFRWLERGGAVEWDAYLKEFRVTDRAALARLIRWDGQQALTAAFRAGHVADADRPP
jgi:hypothetical protein